MGDSGINGVFRGAFADAPVTEVQLDEPTSHLDFGNQHRFLKLLKNMKSMGVGVVMTSHFPDHALATSDKAVTLKGGRITSERMPEEVITETIMPALYGVPVEVVDTKYGRMCIVCD
jgi:iron complex transport system ATP-binding protein